MKYAYQRNGAPLLSWNRAPPQGSRAADARALGGLGSLEGHSIKGSSLDGPTLELPRAGAPEPVGGLGCGCTAIGDVAPAAAPTGLVDKIGALSTPVKIAGVVGAYLLYKKLTKKKR